MKKLGFGLMRLPVLDESDRSTVDMQTLRCMTDRFMERGFTYFDTAHRYNDEASEPAIRKALVKGHCHGVQGIVYGEGAWQLGDIQGNKAMDEAYEMGKQV